MKAAELLADLTARGFRLDVRGNRIGVEPASRLTDKLIQTIRAHKSDLLVLLRTAAAQKAKRTARKKKLRKTEKRAAAPRIEVREGGDRAQPPEKPEPRPKCVPGPKRQKPPLCASCRQRGSPNCTTCSLAYDSSLELGKDGVLYRVRPQTEEDRLDWRRCELCGSPFQAPLFGSPNVCPECRGRRT